MNHCDNLSLTCLQYQPWAYIWDFTLLCVFKTNSVLWVVNMILHLICGETQTTFYEQNMWVPFSSVLLQELFFHLKTKKP